MKRIKLSDGSKARLLKESGGKCANPGCATSRVEYHHIKEWATFKSNNEEDMIAICPTCHDAVHHGKLEINDDILYRWKAIQRPQTGRLFQLHIDPGAERKIRFGSFWACSENPDLNVLDLNSKIVLKFRTIDGDMMRISAEFVDAAGRRAVWITDNTVRTASIPEMKVIDRPGHIKITVPNNGKFVPEWFVRKVNTKRPDTFSTDDILLFEIEITAPGTARIMGCFVDKYAGVLLLDRESISANNDSSHPLHIIGNEETYFVLKAEADESHKDAALIKLGYH